MQCLTYRKDAVDNKGCGEGRRAREDGDEKEKADRRKRREPGC